MMYFWVWSGLEQDLVVPDQQDLVVPEQQDLVVPEQQDLVVLEQQDLVVLEQWGTLRTVRADRPTYHPDNTPGTTISFSQNGRSARKTMISFAQNGRTVMR